MAKRGKKVLDIDWENDGVRVKVPVKAYTVHDFGSGKEVMKFRAEYPEADVDVEDTDINKIREKVIERLNSWYSVDWELYFLVTVSGGDYGHSATDFKIGFEMKFYVVGKDSRGQVRHMNVPRPEKFPVETGKCPTRWGGETPHDGWPKTGAKIKSDSWNTRNPDTRSLVKATPENVRAADQFVEAMKGLLERMHAHFAPERIEAMLGRAAFMLPAPVKKE